jgi:hypothetical protein
MADIKLLLRKQFLIILSTLGVCSTVDVSNVNHLKSRCGRSTRNVTETEGLWVKMLIVPLHLVCHVTLRTFLGSSLQ